ncbi:cell wall protein [Microbacterium jiangjiandongii]|uniref:cell wall protein n=1 Tax=Microbacterium jiangjiandongii TaxID=3049071 RepID=UPI00214C75DA|nr:cell wall protein [Microbacterium sp. zg.Y843]MCR2814573.1 cell wall protein [Microbacterium sp. zg.Y843]
MMFRSTVSAIALAALVIIGAPAAASAATPPPDPYTPDLVVEPSLTGSSAVGECLRDAPYIDYSVVLADPDSQVSETAVTMTLTNGVQSTDPIPLGDLVDGRLSGRVLWPGAVVGPDGAGVGWPGYELVDGDWVRTDANFAWTRGNVTAVLHVNPSISVPISYPQATPECLTATTASTGASGGSAGLAATGGTTAALLPLGLGAGALVAGGAGLLLLRRHRSARS